MGNHVEKMAASARHVPTRKEKLGLGTLYCLSQGAFKGPLLVNLSHLCTLDVPLNEADINEAECYGPGMVFWHATSPSSSFAVVVNVGSTERRTFRVWIAGFEE